jgi:two-component system LytT family sensor kinase
MRPPAERRLDLYGSGTDVPAPPKIPRGLRRPLIFLVATGLGVLSSTLAWQFTHWLGRPDITWESLAILNFAYWYLWAVMTPAIVWLSQRFRFERGGLLRAFAVHLPAVVASALAHIAAMQGVQWVLAEIEGAPFPWWTEVQQAALQYLDWEMITYWAIVGLSHALLYYRESRGRAVRAAQLEIKLAEAQLTTLQQQLQPHFLFNTLHAISALMHRDVEAADRMLTRLSDLLRITLENLGQSEVPLKTELDFLGKYLQIEQTRFADRLIVRFDVQPEALDTRVPSLLLQPLVENAIKHGVARKAGPGHIDISARRDGDKLRLEVRDDGVGLSEDALTALQKGIGVSTTRARLQHLFGADFRFEFHRLSEGLAVVVALPWHTGPLAHAAPAPVEDEARGGGTEGSSRSFWASRSIVAVPLGSQHFTLFRRKTS